MKLPSGSSHLFLAENLFLKKKNKEEEEEETFQRTAASETESAGVHCVLPGRDGHDSGNNTALTVAEGCLFSELA